MEKTTDKHKELNRQKQICRKIDKQSNRQADIRIDRQTDRPSGR